MMPVTRLLPALLAGVSMLNAQAPAVAKGIAEFNRGNYTGARDLLRLTPADPYARAYLAFIRAATGECDAAIPELTVQFNAKATPTLRRLAGLALAQCRIAAKQFGEAALLVARLEKY